MKRNEFDIFRNSDDSVLEQIAKEYTVLTDEEKERMFAMSERKYNITNNSNGTKEMFTEDSAAEVRGVERYKRPVWSRAVSIAAAAVLIAGGVGGGAYFMHTMKKTAPGKDEANIGTTVTTQVPTETTTEFNLFDNFSSWSDEACKQQGLFFTDLYSSIEMDVLRKHLKYDSNDFLTFHTDGGQSGSEGYDLKWYKVTDERYPDMGTIITRYSQLYNAGIPENEAKLFDSGWTSAEYPDGCTIPYEKSCKLYMEYDGQLYVNSLDYDTYFNGWADNDIRLIEKNDDKIVIERTGYINFTDGETDNYRFEYIRNSRSGGLVVTSITHEKKSGEQASTNGNTDNESLDVAKEMTEKFLTFENKVELGHLKLDENDWFCINIEELYPEGQKRTPKYCRVTESGYDSAEAITSTLFELGMYDYVRNGLSIHGLGAVDEVANGSTVDVDFSNAFQYLTYDGKLYICVESIHPQEMVWTDDTINIIKVDENEIQTSRKYGYKDSEGIVSSDGDFYLVFKRDGETGEWRHYTHGIKNKETGAVND
jgi:hypothetical protein